MGHRARASDIFPLFRSHPSQLQVFFLVSDDMVDSSNHAPRPALLVPRPQTRPNRHQRLVHARSCDILPPQEVFPRRELLCGYPGADIHLGHFIEYFARHYDLSVCNVC